VAEANPDTSPPCSGSSRPAVAHHDECAVAGRLRPDEQRTPRPCYVAALLRRVARPLVCVADPIPRAFDLGCIRSPCKGFLMLGGPLLPRSLASLTLGYIILPLQG